MRRPKPRYHLHPQRAPGTRRRRPLLSSSSLGNGNSKSYFWGSLEVPQLASPGPRPQSVHGCFQFTSFRFGRGASLPRRHPFARGAPHPPCSRLPTRSNSFLRRLNHGLLRGWRSSNTRLLFPHPHLPSHVGRPGAPSRRMFRPIPRCLTIRSSRRPPAARPDGYRSEGRLAAAQSSLPLLSFSARLGTVAAAAA